MSFEYPERKLTEEEWKILSESAIDNARNIQWQASQYFKLANETDDEKQMKDYLKMMKFTSKKADKIYQVLINIENEYYENHPDEDPDKEDK